MDPFVWTEQRYTHLKQLQAAGDLDAAQFNELAESLWVQDDHGRSWRLLPAIGTWYVTQAGRWVPAQSPRSRLSRRRKAALVAGGLGLLSACSGCALLSLVLARGI